MIRRPPRSTLDRSSAASDVYKRQVSNNPEDIKHFGDQKTQAEAGFKSVFQNGGLPMMLSGEVIAKEFGTFTSISPACLLYTSDAADERSSVDLGGRRIIKKKTTAHNQ